MLHARQPLHFLESSGEFAHAKVPNTLLHSVASFVSPDVEVSLRRRSRQWSVAYTAVTGMGQWSAGTWGSPASRSAPAMLSPIFSQTKVRECEDLGMTGFALCSDAKLSLIPLGTKVHPIECCCNTCYCNVHWLAPLYCC
jgi:hypothetical protein